jgi:hypothetical protein
MRSLLIAFSAAMGLMQVNAPTALANPQPTTVREHILLARQVDAPTETKISVQLVPIGAAAAANCAPVSTSFDALDPQGRVLLSDRTFGEAFASFDTSALNGTGAFDGEFYIVSVTHELSDVQQGQHCKSVVSIRLGDATFGSQNSVAAEPQSGAPPRGFLIGPIESNTPVLLATIVHWPSCKPSEMVPAPMVVVRDTHGATVHTFPPFGDGAVTTVLEGGFTVYTHKLDLPALRSEFATIELPSGCAAYNATTSGDPPLRKEIHRIDPVWKIEKGEKV